MDDRELRQYFDDIYQTYLGSYIKNNYNENSEDLVKNVERHWRVLVAAMEDALERYHQDKDKSENK